jgi:hypothetical protein
MFVSILFHTKRYNRMSAKATPPTNIVLQEQLVMWAIIALDTSVPTQAVLERPNLTSFNCEWQLIKTPEGVEAFVGRVVLPLATIDELPAGSKFWLQAKNIPSSAAIAAYYSTN